jgi:hypothetical protein
VVVLPREWDADPWSKLEPDICDPHDAPGG